MKVLETYLVLAIMLEATNAQFLNQPDSGIFIAHAQYRANLTCSVEEEYVIDWLVSWSNGEEVDASSDLGRHVLMERGFIVEGVVTNKSTLSLQGSIINNATNITCLAQETGARRSPIAGNTVQVIFYAGVPPPPTNPIVTKNDLSSFNISWSLGFIEGVPVNYTLAVLNLNTTSAQPIIIAGLLDQHYVFETSRPCDVYSFTVTAVTAAGNSTPSQEIIFTRDQNSDICIATIPKTTSSDKPATTFTSFSLPATQANPFQPLTTSSPETQDNSTIILIAAVSIAFAVLMSVLVLVNVMICVFCYKKNKTDVKSDLKDPVYETPGDVTVILSSVKDREMPFAMTSSSAYILSQKPSLKNFTNLAPFKSPDTSEGPIIPFTATSSSAYEISRNPPNLEIQDKFFPTTLPLANVSKNADSEDGTVSIAMTSLAAYENLESEDKICIPSPHKSSNTEDSPMKSSSGSSHKISGTLP